MVGVICGAILDSLEPLGDHTGGDLVDVANHFRLAISTLFEEQEGHLTFSDVLHE